MSNEVFKQEYLLLLAKENELIDQPFIELTWDDGHKIKIGINQMLRGIKHNGKRPTGINWRNLDGIEVDEEMLDWLHAVLMPVFEPGSINDIFRNFKQKRNYEISS